jgi:aspartate/methionine/tyrosine aminotransferase
MTKSEELLPSNASMRDIFDFCSRKGLPSVAQGMIELPPPETLRQTASELTLKEDVHTYRNRFGTVEYHNGLLNLLHKHYNANEMLTTDNILATHGVTGACITVLSYVKQQGKSRVGIVSPFYSYHLREVENIFGEKADITYIKLKENPDTSITTASRHFWLDLEELENVHLRTGLDVIMICNPGNPSTHVYAQDDIDRLVKLCEEYNTYLLIDECYCDMVWQGKHYSPIAKAGVTITDDVISKNVFIARGFSKNIGCQSWRVGYLIAHKTLIPQLMQIGDPIYICVPFTQTAIGNFLQNNLDKFVSHQNETQKLMRENWKILSKAFKEALNWKPIEPEGSMYGLFYHDKESDLEAVMDALNLGVGVCHMSIFYEYAPKNTGMIRIHCGISAKKAAFIAETLRKNSHKD